MCRGLVVERPANQLRTVGHYLADSVRGALEEIPNVIDPALLLDTRSLCQLLSKRNSVLIGGGAVNVHRVLRSGEAHHFRHVNALLTLSNQPSSRTFFCYAISSVLLAMKRPPQRRVHIESALGLRQLDAAHDGRHDHAADGRRDDKAQRLADLIPELKDLFGTIEDPGLGRGIL